jgi:hypothetical protein
VSSCSPRCFCHGEGLPLVVEPSRDDRPAAAEAEPPVRIPGLGEVLVGLICAKPANSTATNIGSSRARIGPRILPEPVLGGLPGAAVRRDVADGVRGQPASERRPCRLCAGHWCATASPRVPLVGGRPVRYPDPGLAGRGSRRRCCGRACACRVRRCAQTLHRGLIGFVSGPDALGSAGSRRRPGRPIRTVSVSALLPKRAETPLALPPAGSLSFRASRAGLPSRTGGPQGPEPDPAVKIEYAVELNRSIQLEMVGSVG